ncbi:MAG: hypothetical protein ACC682_04005 [Gemmatimonadota bacterium]
MASTTGTGRRAFGVQCFAGASLSLLVSVSALAAQATPLVCSLTQAVECDETLGCETFSPEIAAPTFLHIDLDRSVVTILGPEERRGEATEVQTVADFEGHTILTGTQRDRGWSMSISKADGGMSLTISDDHVGFVVFGRCIASDRLSP